MIDRTADIFDDTNCELGEGPLWHPGRGQLYWFDITGSRLLTRQGQTHVTPLPEMFSAAGWISDTELFMCSETGFWRHDLEEGSLERLGTLEANTPTTRSNDGRADPQGGFWIGTMGKKAEKKAGAIYRWYRGEVRKLVPGISIPNAICFSPDGLWAYFTDTTIGTIHRVALDEAGWPKAAPEPMLPLGNPFHPDGAVTDAAGNLWIAQWGHAKVTCMTPAGKILGEVRVGGRHSSCPAFGGPGLDDLYVTSAMQGIDAATRAAEPANGRTFLTTGVTPGRPEPQVLL